MFKPAYLLLALMFLSLANQANDIASSVRDGRSPESVRGGSFELGFVAGYVNNPLMTADEDFDGWVVELDAAGEVRFKNFFFEAAQGTQDGLNLGFNLWSNENWSFDILGASMVGRIDTREDSDIEPDDDEEERNRKIEKRDTFYLGTGFRLTRYFDKYIVQYRFVTDTYKDHGIVNTLRFGRGWQVKNWHLSTILSAQYSSQKTNEYWVGISDREATTKFPEYSPSATMSYSLLFNLTKPLTEKWVMRAYAGYVHHPDEIKESPIFKNHDFSIAAITFNYVLF